jgi:hypothetical protein
LPEWVAKAREAAKQLQSNELRKKEKREALFRQIEDDITILTSMVKSSIEEEERHKEKSDNEEA